MTPRPLLAVLLLLVAAGCAGLPTPGTPDAASTGDGRAVTVVHVVDGDTMDVRFADGTEDRVRLLGVDAPESHADVSPGEWEGVPDTPQGRECLRAWGDHASEFATRELEGRTVMFVADPESDARGGYGRLLGYLAYGDTTLNHRLLETGHARLYDTDFSQRDAFAALERDAQSTDRGAWTCRTPTDGE